MKLLLISGLVILIPYLGRTAEKHSRVLLTDVQVDFLRSYYINRNTWKAKLVKVNDGYNSLNIDIEIMHDFPTDTQLDVQVFRSSSKDGPWDNIANYTAQVCDQSDEYRYYFSRLLSKLTLGHCIQKGKYQVKDSVLFRYYDILSEDDVKGYYFSSKHTLCSKSADVTIATIEYKTQSNDMD